MRIHLVLAGLLVACGGAAAPPDSTGPSGVPSGAESPPGVGAESPAGVGAESPASVGAESPARVALEDRADLANAFTERGFDGAFVSWEAGATTGVCVGGELCGRVMVPASTYKIPHALIALETGVATGPDHEREWDGEERAIDAWNRDHTLASAIEFSAVWYFQEVAREIGPERMRDWLGRLDFGNGEIGSEIDQFWLDGPLAISPRDQVAWWHRFMAGDLPVSAEHQEQVAAMATRERWEGGRLVAKTGWATMDGRDHGWLVGCVEHEATPSRCFATLVLAPDPFDQGAFLAARTDISRELLRALGSPIPAAPPTR